MHDPPPSNPPAEPPAPGPAAPPAGRGARWGEPGYQAPPDPNRHGRLAAALIFGVLGTLGLVVVAVAGFALLYSMGTGQPAPVTATPFPTIPPQTTLAPSLPGLAAPTTTAGADEGAPARSSNGFYSIRIPDGFQDVTDDYRNEHAGEGDTVQALAGRPGSLVTPDATIVINRLPAGAAGGRSLDRLAADRVRALPGGGGGDPAATRHSSIGPDPAVEVDLTLRSTGQTLNRTQVLCVHDGRVWEIAVTSPAGSRSLAAQAWTLVKTGWQWV